MIFSRTLSRLAEGLRPLQHVRAATTGNITWRQARVLVGTHGKSVR